jgi:hypothetical protein
MGCSLTWGFAWNQIQPLRATLHRIPIEDKRRSGWFPGSFASITIAILSLDVSFERGIRSVAEERSFGAQVAGVAAESAARDDAEGFQAQGRGHFRDQAIELQAGGVRVLLELGAQEQSAAEPGEVRSGHAEVFPVGVVTVTQRAVDPGIALRPPGPEHVGGQRKNHVAHVDLALVFIHFRPRQTLAVCSLRAYPLRIAGPYRNDDKNHDQSEAKWFHLTIPDAGLDGFSRTGGGLNFRR